MSHRVHIDNSVKLIGKLLFGIEKGSEVLDAIRPTGQPLVDDWDCLKNMVQCRYNWITLISCFFLDGSQWIDAWQFHSSHQWSLVKFLFRKSSVILKWCDTYRLGALRHAVDPSPSTEWNTWDPLQTSAMLESARSRWQRHRRKLAWASPRPRGALFTRASQHDDEAKPLIQFQSTFLPPLFISPNVQMGLTTTKLFVNTPSVGRRVRKKKKHIIVICIKVLLAMVFKNHWTAFVYKKKALILARMSNIPNVSFVMMFICIVRHNTFTKRKVNDWNMGERKREKSGEIDEIRVEEVHTFLL